jgi:probable rRNA maturation factor
MIEINNLTNFPVDKKFLTGVAKKVLKGENREIENISIAFVSSDEIKKLNQKYRKKNKPTDVLSFGKSLDFESDTAEIVICPEIVKDNGDELAKMLIHGILHILGYDHEKTTKEAEEMERKQKKYLSKI